MRPPNQSARQQFRAAMRRGPLTAREIAQAAGVSNRTALRLLSELGDEALPAGPPIRRRYALRRPLRGDTRALPVFTIDTAGRAREAGNFGLIEPGGSHFDLHGLGWPVDSPSLDGWWEGLPYPLYDMCPQGFLGRLFARTEHVALEVPADPRDWSDADVAWILTRRGADLPGNLVVGEPALRLFQSRLVAPGAPVGPDDLPATYARLADEVTASGVPGSSAAGEFPKFIASRDLASAATPHVIVKFSAPVDSRTTERWSDLLVCEHLALSTLSRAQPSARTRIIQHAGRTFLESERFDRHGITGRSPVVSLGALAGHLLGLGTTDWRDHARALARLDCLDEPAVTAVHELWWFGALIGNTDMHAGNLGLVPRDGKLAVAPAYDMLPMAWAPLPGGEIPPRDWRPALPLPADTAVWLRMCALAIEFWRLCASDARVSEGFRAICANNASLLDDLAAKI